MRNVTRENAGQPHSRAACHISSCMTVEGTTNSPRWWQYLINDRRYGTGPIFIFGATRLRSSGSVSYLQPATLGCFFSLFPPSLPLSLSRLASPSGPHPPNHARGHSGPP